MSEENDPQPNPPEGDPPESPETGDEGADLKAELDKWKSLARKNEQQAKANADAAKRLAEIEDSQKSEVEKLTEAQKAAETRAAEAEQRAMRLEVAAAKGLTPAQAKRLVGASMEELESDADELLSTFQPPSEERTETELPRRPTERLRPGARPAAEPQPSAKEIVDRMTANTL